VENFQTCLHIEAMRVSPSCWLNPRVPARISQYLAGEPGIAPSTVFVPFSGGLLSQVYITSQTFLTLNGPGIFYSTHAARAHASAAARTHSSCFHDNDATSTRVCTRVYTAVDLVYSSTCSTKFRSKFSTSLDHNKWICGFLWCMYTWVQCTTHTYPQIYLL
jgi:hypothetical protein